MELALIESTVVKICDAIADVLNVDVIVVDQELNIIANTYKHMDENDIEVYESSIIASSINEREKKIIFDIARYPKCQRCADKDICKIAGVVAVPIIHEGKALGSIGIMLSRKGDMSRLSQQEEGMIGFLENMVELLIGKWMSIVQLENIETVNHQIEHIVANVRDAIVYLDQRDKIVFYNDVFKSYFKIDEDIKGKDINHVIKHTIIKNYLVKKRNVTDEIFVLENSKISFQGLISCTNTNLNSEYLGSILTIRKIEETYRVINEILNNKSNYEMHELIIEDAEVNNELDKAKRLAIKDDALLIIGESGTGKKSLACRIHNFSSRKNHYIITIDCQFRSRDYYLAELFGIGKSIINPGMMHLADKGTIVFHDIGKMPLNVQKDILNYIIRGTIELERGVVIKDLDVRIIATSQEDLKVLVKEGYFLEELYYRLCENVINLKPLNERTFEDFKIITQDFLNHYSEMYSKDAVGIEKGAIEKLYFHRWNDNVKGYERFIEKLVYSHKGHMITESSAINELSKISLDSTMFEIKTYDEYEHEFIEKALNEYKDHKNRIDIVASKLGIGRATLYRKINKYNLA